MTLPIRLRALALLLALFVFFLSIQPFAAHAASAGEDEISSSTTHAAVFRGRASWYGREHQGHSTSSGERFNRFKYTCAHRTLPFGTRLRITNPDNGQSVVVRVTDRGPFRNQRVLDVSEVAARPLAIVQHGAINIVAEIVDATTPLGPTKAPLDLANLLATDTTSTLAATNVTLSMPAPTAPIMLIAKAVIPPKPTFIVQAGTFGDPRNAEAQLSKIKTVNALVPVRVETGTVSEKAVSRVLIGQFEDWASAEKVRRQLNQHGISSLVRQLPTPAPVEAVAAK